MVETDNVGHGASGANVAVHPAEGRCEAPLPRFGCNGLLDLTALTVATNYRGLLTGDQPFALMQSRKTLL